ncbi:MAG: hypothetical protein AAGM22_18370 [Acidobacteriota bacterium]
MRLSVIASWLPITLFILTRPAILAAEGLPVNHLQVAGVSLIQDSEELSRHLGRPIASHATTDRATGEAATISIFRNLTAYLVADETMRLKTTDPSVSTVAGAKVGDSVARVLELYEPFEPEIVSPGQVELCVKGSRACLVFYSYRDQVTAIEVLLDYG